MRFAADGINGLFGQLVTGGPDAALRAVLGEFDRNAYCADAHVWIMAEDNGHERHRHVPNGALVVRCPGRRVLVVGQDPLAYELRVLLHDSCAGWELLPLPGRQILLEVAEPILGHRAYNMLTRAGFRTVDEVVAMPVSALRNIRNLGTKSLAAIRDVETAHSASLLRLETDNGDGHDGEVSDVRNLTTDQLVSLWASAAQELQRRGMRATPDDP